MNYSKVIEVLSDNWDMSKAETRRLLDAIIHTFTDNLAQGIGFTIPELGTFTTTTKSERTSFNPYYEKYMRLPPKRTVQFTPSKRLKEDLKHLDTEK